MTIEELQNSPLHGLSDETVLSELVEFYGWDVLDAAIDLKCFRIKPTIPSCLVFLKKAEWARNRVEGFYLCTFKGMPKPSDEELEREVTPRERGFAIGVTPKQPKPLTIKKAQDERMEKERAEESGDEPRRSEKKWEKPARVEKPRARPDRVEKPKEEPEPEPEPEPEESTFRSRFSRPRD